MTEETAAPRPHLQGVMEHSIAMVWLFASWAMVFGICMLLITGKNVAARDHVSFWVASHQLAAHADPYDAASTLALERAAGFPSTKQALIMRNPPYALPLVLPLAPFQLKSAARLWSLLLLTSLLISVHLFWIASGRPANPVHVLGYTFGPAMLCLVSGQSALFALLGLVLFLRLHREHSFAAGASLWLCALKPHLFLPFGVVLLLWVAVTRRYRLLAGAVFALAASSAIAAWLDPAAWAQYSRMMHSPNLQAEFIPTIGCLLRSAVPNHPAWLQYLPTAIACSWAVYFFLGRRRTWDWLHDGAVIMLVSILTAPYAWVSDQSVLIPALLTGAYSARSRMQIGLLALFSALVDIVQLAGKDMHSVIYVFGPPIWLGWYLYATRKRSVEIKQEWPQNAAFAIPEPGAPSL